MKNKKNIYLDMDGTLTEFRYVPIEELYKPGYFLSLRENERVVEAAKKLAAEGVNVTVLSCYLADSQYAYEEKKQWLDEHLPEVPYILLPCGVNKAEKVKELIGRELNESDLLIDDFSYNLFDWEEAGGKAIKLLNGINGMGRKWKGERIHYRAPVIAV